MTRRRGGRALGGLALAVLLAAAGAAADEAADLEATAGDGAGDCVAACESRRDACARTAQTQADECARRRRACDEACAPCTGLQGPLVVYCVQDCEACRARLARMACPPLGDARSDCEQRLDACRKRCRP